MKTIIGKFVTPTEVAHKKIFIDEFGLISKIESANFVNEADYIYGDECLIFSSFGDIHVHAREDQSQKHIYKEDFNSASKAAINGGVTHLGDMPNNPIPPIDDATYINKLRLSVNRKTPYLLYAGVGPSTKPLSFKVPYKAFMGPSIGELYFKDEAELENSIKRYSHQYVSFHCEDPEVLESNKTKVTHFEKRPVSAEIVATKTALSLTKKYQLKAKLCHYSSGEGLDQIILAKKEGISVTCEVTPQHLYYSSERILSDFSKDEVIYFQMNPPIRFKEDREKLLWALKNGHIDYLATDHAPHSKEEKEKGISGMPGLDTYSLFITWLLLIEKVDPKIIAKVSSYNPGQFFNEFLPSLKKLDSYYERFGLGFGVLEVGYSGSFTVLNLARKKVFKNEDMCSKAHWSCFHGVEFPGSLEAVFINGEKL